MVLAKCLPVDCSSFAGADCVPDPEGAARDDDDDERIAQLIININNMIQALSKIAEVHHYYAGVGFAHEAQDYKKGKQWCVGVMCWVVCCCCCCDGCLMNGSADSRIRECSVFVHMIKS
jgi:hypothetical protein